MATVERRHRELALDAMHPGVDPRSWWCHEWVASGTKIEESSQLARVAQALADAEAKAIEPWELELKALDLLCGLVSEEDGTVVFRVLDTGSRHCQARIIPAQGDTAGRAALALARKMGLLP
jgi:hypothetical protein